MWGMLTLYLGSPDCGPGKSSLLGFVSKPFLLSLSVPQWLLVFFPSSGIPLVSVPSITSFVVLITTV